MKKFTKILVPILLSGLATACGSDSSYSILSTGDSFQQSSEAVDVKIDVLWLIDTSGSMAEEQDALAANFSSFISGFLAKNYDFRIAVATTAAWQSFYPAMNAASTAEFKSCHGTAPNQVCSGYPIIDKSTPNPEQAFLINVRQGTGETGDERSFQSIKAVLERTKDPASVNYNFHRPDAFLAIIIVSDEDDFSHSGTKNLQPTFAPNHNENWSSVWRYKNSSITSAGGTYNPNSSCGGACTPTGPQGIRQWYENKVYPAFTLDPISNYVTYLDQFTGFTGADGQERQYNVSAFAVRAADQRTATCGAGFGGMLGIRNFQLAEATGGTAADLCGNFADELELIQDEILALIAKFYLSTRPIASTIKVSVNGVVVPEASANNGEGWTYFEDLNSKVYYVTFSSAPSQGAQISITFDPYELTF